MTKKAILIVDDEGILLLSLKSSLRLRFGDLYRYETALNGADGLERIGTLVADGFEVVLVISDWLMPGMKGDEFLSMVHQRHPSTRLIMLSGHTDEAEMAKLSDAIKLEAFLRKPWDPEQLFQIIESSLG